MHSEAPAGWLERMEPAIGWSIALAWTLGFVVVVESALQKLVY